MARSEKQAAWFAAHKEEMKAYAAAYRSANKEKAKEYAKAYYAANKAAWVESGARYRKDNPASAKAAQKRYRHANREMTRASWQARYAAQLKRTPPWFGELDQLVFLEAHDLAKLRWQSSGVRWDVDHFLPLQGRVVSGLHVWNNVRVIPASLNRSKCNRVTPEMLEAA